MTSVVCEYCNKKFSKRSNLTKHQQSAKYCQSLQEERALKDAELTCDYCKKVLSRSDSLSRHYMSCIEYLIYQQVQVFEKEIQSLRERLAEKDLQLKEKEAKLWELTNTSINKTTNAYTHIGQVTINTGHNEQLPTAATKYPSIPESPQDIKDLIDKLYNEVMTVFVKPPQKLLMDKPVTKA